MFLYHSPNVNLHQNSLAWMKKSGMEHKRIIFERNSFKKSLIDKANVYHMCTIGQQVEREEMVL